MSLSFTFLGAGVFAVGRTRDKSVPQEAIIGIVYAVSSAVAILVLDRTPHGEEAIETMLVGSILFATWPQVAKIAVMYLAVGLLALPAEEEFLLISMNPGAGPAGAVYGFASGISFSTSRSGDRDKLGAHRRCASGLQLLGGSGGVRDVLCPKRDPSPADRLGAGIRRVRLRALRLGEMGFPHGRLRGRHVRRRAGRLRGREGRNGSVGAHSVTRGRSFETVASTLELPGGSTFAVPGAGSSSLWASAEAERLRRCSRISWARLKPTASSVGPMKMPMKPNAATPPRMPMNITMKDSLEPRLMM